MGLGNEEPPSVCISSFLFKGSPYVVKNLRFLTPLHSKVLKTLVFLYFKFTHLFVYCLKCHYGLDVCVPPKFKC